MKNRLPELRAERQLTQEALARMIGVSRQTVNAIETGRHDPSLRVAFAIARVFHSPIEEVFLCEQPKAEESVARASL